MRLRRAVCVAWRGSFIERETVTTKGCLPSSCDICSPCRGSFNPVITATGVGRREETVVLTHAVVQYAVGPQEDRGGRSEGCGAGQSVVVHLESVWMRIS